MVQHSFSVREKCKFTKARARLFFGKVLEGKSKDLNKDFTGDILSVTKMFQHFLATKY